MIGSWRWNMVLASVGMVLTILLSLQGNVWLTTLIRGLYTFICLFAFAYLIRWFLGFVIRVRPMEHLPNAQQVEEDEEDQKGKHIDLTTPIEDDEKMDAPSASFSPLNPPKLTTKGEMKPEDMAKVVRHMTEQ